MDVSKLTISENLKHQESLEHKIYRWMQEHGDATKNTNITKMANWARIPGYQTSSVSQKITQMVKQGKIRRFGNRKKARFDINYYVPEIPEDILENAPEDIKGRVNTMKASLKDNQYINNDGALVTKSLTTESPTKEESTEDNEKVVEESPMEEPETRDEQKLEVPIQIEKDGKSLAITVNLTINL